MERTYGSVMRRPDRGGQGDDFHRDLYPRRYHDLPDQQGTWTVSFPLPSWRVSVKGKGLKPEWEEEMKAHDVPDWYIWSCKKIKYMFPKAHAAAYVMMAYRIAYYKIFIRWRIMRRTFHSCVCIFLRAHVHGTRPAGILYERLRKTERHADFKKEQATVKDMKIVQEMYARGFDFVPVDLYKAQHRFQVYDDKHLMPALDWIEGLGDKAADAVVLAARNGKFLSKDDFRDRTKVSKTIIDFMADLGVFGDLPESNQFSLFDY